MSKLSERELAAEIYEGIVAHIVQDQEQRGIRNVDPPRMLVARGPSGVRLADSIAERLITREVV